ncbi:MAG: dihydrodipicolinate synthase family protein [Chloroflexota bacterium]
MTAADLSGRLAGVMVALVTPLADDGSLDEAAVERIARRSIQAGVRGICPVGSTGEGPHLSRRLRHQAIGSARAAAGPDILLIPAVVSTSAEEAREELEAYARLGANAALVTPPFYYPLSPAAVEDFFTGLADRSPLPLLMYNIPRFTKVPIPPEVVGRLAAHGRIAGIKDSSRDFEYFLDVVGAAGGRDDFSILTGSDTMLMPSLLMGGHGTITASANLVPALDVELYQAVKAEDWQHARNLQEKLRLVGVAMRRGSFPGAWKAALEMAGLCSGRTAPPTERLGQRDREGLRAALRDLEVIGEQ